MPFLCNWIFSILYSSSLDFARGKEWINTTQARKISMGIGKQTTLLYRDKVHRKGH